MTDQPDPVVDLQSDASIDPFLDTLWMEEGLAALTLSAYRQDLRTLGRWLHGHGKTLLQADADDLLGFFAAHHARTKATTANRRLTVCKRFYRWALREHRIAQDPTLTLLSARQPLRVPDSLTERQVEALLAAPDVHTAQGVRDRTMLELMYACGLRVTELVTLQCHQVSMTELVLRVVGKGSRERIVPFGEIAGLWLERYMAHARPELLAGKASVDLFVTHRGSTPGTAMSRMMFWMLVRQYAVAAGITQQLSPHTLRHAFATHLLDHGADLRSVQLLLGHANVSTTTIYTHVARQRLHDLHARHHPRG